MSTRQGHVWCPMAVSNCFSTGSCLVPQGSFTVLGHVWCPMAVSNCFNTGSCLVPHGSFKLFQYRVMSGAPWQFQTVSVQGHVWCPMTVSQYWVMSGAPWQFQTASVQGHVWWPMAVSNRFNTGSCLVPHGSFKLLQYRVMSGAPGQFQTASVQGHVWCPRAVSNCFSKLHTCYQLLVAYSPQFWFSTLTQGVNSSCECDSTLQGEDSEWLWVNSARYRNHKHKGKLYTHTMMVN